MIMRYDSKNIDVNVDATCRYSINKCLEDKKGYLSTKDRYIYILISGYLTDVQRKIVFNKTLRELLVSQELIRLLQSLKEEGITLEIELLNSFAPNRKGFFYLNFSNNLIEFYDEYNNNIKFDDKDSYKVVGVKTVKKIRNEIVYPTLEEYISHVKEIEVMKSFRHNIQLTNGDCIDLLFGNRCKAYRDDEVIENDEFNNYLSLQIKYIDLSLNN